MEIRELAERVLFGTRLEDKLCAADSLSDAQPGPGLIAPAEPHRPPGLGLVRRARTEFPGHLDRVGERGRALHHFALHELLAMELMALVLLRFPDAPRAFRRGIATALAEEQAHFALYHARMRACGTELGEVPASAHFWDALVGMQSALDFVLGMSLTFEQANLDHALHYQKAFAAVGDAETADVLRQVYEDEIGHVKLGLVWFRRWAEPTNEWDEYTKRLPTTLHPGRARGPHFNAEGRRLAGFDPGYIEQIQVFTRSRGRVPALWSFDPSAELVAGGQAVPDIVRQLGRDLETLPMFLAASDDTVQVSRPPRPAFLASLAEAGFALPEFATDTTGRRFSAVRPWADLEGTPRALFSKAWGAEQLRNLLNLGVFSDEDAIGVACHDAGEVEADITRLRSLGHQSIVAKAAFGTAGRGLMRVDTGVPRRWLARALASGPVVVEPWLDRVLDLGIQLSVGDEVVAVDGTTRNLVDTRGQHRGVALVKGGVGLPEALRRFYLADSTRELLHATGEHIGQALRAAGHRGFAGIDALVYRHGGGFRLKPVVEVNPRTTMGRVALGLKRRIAPGTCAVWVQLPADGIEATPVQVRGTPAQIVDGVVHTTDPVDARFTTALVVAPTLEGLRTRLAGRVVAVDPLLERSDQPSV